MTVDPKTLRANWNYPTTIRIGPGRIAELAAACREIGMARPLLVTDPGLAALPMVKEAIAANAKAGVPTGLYTDLKPNPVSKNVADGVAAFRAGRHDGIVAFGGGSALDTGKSIAFMAGQTRPIWDFEDIGDWWTRADASGIAPVIAVPTTAGTGSEVGRATAIINEKTHEKKIIFHPRMMPRIVLADPELMVGLPPKLTAGTGMDALAHCFEAYCAPGFHPMAEGVAVEGMRLAHRWLARAVKDGRDLAARTYMMCCSMMGATAFQKGLGAVHAISHPVGALYDLHHGMTNGVIMPHVLKFNAKAIADKMDHLARALNLKTPGVAGVLDWLVALRAEIGLPESYRAMGVGAERADEIAAMAEVDPTAGGNPVPVKAPELKRLFLDALDGRL
jgi:alcohol dehydrogenase class IV